MNKYNPCPCGSNVFYVKCCKPFHDEAALPDNAQTLMRSRYCAYAIGNVDYIMKTTHPENSEYSEDTPKWKEELKQFSGITHFDGLRILEFIDGADKAYVSFNVSLRQNGEDASFTEKSTFVKENGKWYYRQGDVLEQK
jgi:SEC-C motif domain protein